METKYKIKFPKQFITLAEEFSKTYKILSAGIVNKSKCSTYCSDDSNYRIDYYTKLIDETGRESKTFLKVSIRDTTIQISKKQLIKNDLNENIVFSFLLWGYANYYFYGDINKADEATLNYYFKTGRPLDDFYVGWLQQLSVSPSDFNYKRIDKIQKFIDEKEK